MQVSRTNATTKRKQALRRVYLRGPFHALKLRGCLSARRRTTSIITRKHQRNQKPAVDISRGFVDLLDRDDEIEAREAGACQQRH